MSQRLKCLVGVSSSDDDGGGTLNALVPADQWQAAALSGLVDEEERAVVFTNLDGFCESLFQIFGDDNFLRIHLLTV